MDTNTIVIEKDWMRKFIPIWVAQIFSLLGSGLVQFALIWYITQQTGSAGMLATATIVAILPEVLFAPFAGALVDRLNRRVVMIVADSLIALITLALVMLFAFNLIQVWHIFVGWFCDSSFVTRIAKYCFSWNAKSDPSSARQCSPQGPWHDSQPTSIICGVFFRLRKPVL